MRKLILSDPIFKKGEVLTRSQLKKILGGNGSDEGSDIGCQPGDTLMYSGPDGCGTSVVVIKLPSGECLYDLPIITTPPPCGYAK